MGAGSYTITGGASVQKTLDALARKVGKAGLVEVGFIDKAKYPNVNPVRKTRQQSNYIAQTAFWNEFGTSRSPARPFFRGMIVQQSPTWGLLLAESLKNNNWDLTAALGELGDDIQHALVLAIRNWPADNAPRTVAIKGFNHGLVDSGDMQRHVGYKVTVQ